MVAVTLKEVSDSPNVITLRETIQFGKFRGCTGAQLMKSGEGTSYLVWIFNNTDIQIESSIVNTLAAQGLVKLDAVRKNQKAGGIVEPEKRTLADWGGVGNMMVDAIRAEQRLKHCIKDSVPLDTDRSIVNPVKVRIERRIVPCRKLEPHEREAVNTAFGRAIKRATDALMRDIVM